MPKMLIKETIQQALQMLDEGKSATLILNKLVLAGEKLVAEGEVCSILILDHEGLLRNGASPGLPADYLKAIDKLKPDAKVGTCAAAAATGEMVITPDFRADDKWSELKHLPLALGFKGAWSLPVKNADGLVLGTFGTYFKKSRTPSDEEIESFRLLCEAAASVMIAHNKNSRENRLIG